MKIFSAIFFTVLLLCFLRFLMVFTIFVSASNSVVTSILAMRRIAFLTVFMSASST